MADEQDPLDAFMASLDSEIVKQASIGGEDIHDRTNKISFFSSCAVTSTETSSTSNGAVQQIVGKGPSATQLAIAKKVAASPHCDVLGRGGRSRQRWCTNANPKDEDDVLEMEESCLKLLRAYPADFLRRFGHILSPEDLDSFLPSEDPNVNTHVMHLRSLMLQQRRLEDTTEEQGTPRSEGRECTATDSSIRQQGMLWEMSNVAQPAGDGRKYCPPDSSRSRNRRYRRLQQLAEGGVWFSDEAMKERDPWLWYEHVGKVEGEERPAPRDSKDKVPGSTTVGTYLQESLGFLSQKPKDGEWLASGSSSRQLGSKLGMAFLSGMCLTGDRGGGSSSSRRPMVTGAEGVALREREGRVLSADSGTPDVGAGQLVDCSELPATSPRSGIPGGLQDHRDTDSAIAALKACKIDGDTMIGDNDQDTSRRVRFVDWTKDADTMQDREEDESEKGDGSEVVDDMDTDNLHEEDNSAIDEEEEWGEPGGREEVARTLSERFIAGEEEGVDYSLIDQDERLDDLDQMARDEQDRWFRSQAEETAD